jgi:hypothetical protein
VTYAGINLTGVAITAYLRAYEPPRAFSDEEADRWLAEDPPRRGSEEGQRWLLLSGLPSEEVTARSETAIVIKAGEGVLICPRRTRLRMLAGLLAFRNSVPEEVAEAFVPEEEARRAARELAQLGENQPELRSHILHANWHVPLRWFTAFDDTERVLTEDQDGLRVRYETTVAAAKLRLARAVAILEDAGIAEDGIIDAVRELGEWVEGFDDEGMLELDYGSVASMFEADDLVEDRCASLVWQCLEALETGDMTKAAKIFEILSDRWGAARAREVVN